MKATIRYADGRTEQHESINYALCAVLAAYPDAEQIFAADAGGFPVDSTMEDGEYDVRDGRACLVWLTEEESVNDGGEHAIAEITVSGINEDAVTKWIGEISSEAVVDVIDGRWDDVSTDSLYEKCGAGNIEDMGTARDLAQAKANEFYGQQMGDFMIAFADAIGLDTVAASEQWSGFSRQLSDSDRMAVELGGNTAGHEQGGHFRKLYPATDDES